MKAFRFKPWPLAALLGLGCGLALGWMLPGNDGGAPGPAVPAMAYIAEDSGLTLDAIRAEASAAVPQATPENLFSLAVVQQETADPNPSATALPTAASPAAPTPGPTPAPSAAFAIQVVKPGPEAAQQRRVLIYHTHTYEAYEKLSPSDYQETQRWRTAEESQNVVQVGETLAGLLRGLGFQVEHDRTAFEPPDYNTAYARSLAMLEARRGAGERYDLYIDLHRDAYPASAGGPNTVEAGGTELAKLMLLVGKGEGQTGQGFAQRPDWEKNLALAQAITDSLNTQLPGLCKEVRVKSGRFNQHVAVGCVLIEAGNNLNTLPQVLAAMPYLADAIDQTLPQGGPEAAP